MPYNHTELEQKWQKFWEENQVFQTKNPPFDTQKPKKYILDMFPYPSGSGLHVGHPKGYTATDIVSRFYHAKGYNVLHTMGWDAFGLPAENYAIKTGTHPAVTTAANVAIFQKQLQALGFSYDWSREINTTDPKYYQWTQWIFLELFKRGLAYEQDLPINYCPSCKTGLANEEVLADNTCDRCGTRVEKRALRQWVLKITEYADRLIEDLDGLDWPEGVKEMQRNWIGKSEGCEFRMMKKVEGKPVALILHGWEGKAESNWFMSAKETLEQIGYEVIVPDLPNSNTPNLDEQLAFLGQFASRLDEQSMVIGHSLGGQLAAKFVESLDKRIKTLVMVAPTYPGVADNMSITQRALNEREKAFIPYTNNEIDFEKVTQNSDLQILHISENDPYIDFGTAKKYYQQLSGIRTHVYQNKGHFNEQDGVTSFPELFVEAFDSIEVYTTRVDTVYGMTYAVLAPDHPRVYDFITDEQSAECEAYITEAASRSDQDRTNEGKEKTGVWTGSYVVNPFNGESVQLWIADYVLGHYGTGAVMAVPAHDERDFAFAKRYSLPIKQSIAPVLGTPKQNAVRRDFTKALIVKDGKILVFKFNKFENLYDLPGGGVDEGEDIFTAITREITEETGFQNFVVKECVGSFHMNHHAPVRKVEREAMASFFLVELLNESRVEMSLEEHEDFSWEWLSIEEVLEKFTGIDLHKNFAFAIKHAFSPKATSEDGILVNSSEFNGLSSPEARRVLSEKAESEGFGRKKVNYKLRDWLFSRQRYWGEPIPLIHISNEDFENLPRVNDVSEAIDSNIAYIFDKKGTEKRCKNCTCEDGCTKLIIGGKVYSKIYDGINSKIIIDSNLPLMLPEVEKYEPAGDGQSPLATVPSFVNVELATNLTGKRETNTMPQWGGSCWYYLRYMDPANPLALASKEALEYWQNVDEYVGGTEHAVLHLLYARFWHKVLYDIGVVPTKEPFQKLVNQGMILAYAYERADGGLVAVDLIEEKDGKYFEKSTGKEVKQVVAKMSKSLKNVVNPNDIVHEYGADSLRLYEMSMADFRDTAPWSTDSIIGVRRLLDKAYSTFFEGRNAAKDDMKAMKQLHKTIKKIGEDIVEYKFNTAVSALQILLNEGLPQDAEFQTEWKEVFAILLHPFAPHMAEELWNSLGKKKSVYEATWPEYDEFMLVDDEVTIAVQVGGKLRGTFTFLNGVGQEEVSEVVRADENIAKWLEGKEIVKEIFIPNKMLSIVVK